MIEVSMHIKKSFPLVYILKPVPDEGLNRSETCIICSY